MSDTHNMGRGRGSRRSHARPQATTSLDVFSDLQYRHLVRDCTDTPELIRHLKEPRTIYCGFDPTADSLHIGSLLPLITLRRFQRAGHQIVVLIGGGTGLIGDPSGKAGERVLSEPEEVVARAQALREQITVLLATDDLGVQIVDNSEWLSELSAVSLLRDFGKHFSLGTMLSKESVRSRLDAGISFTEFSYMILQAIDFSELHRRLGCTVQLGGSDQWGNITTGVDLLRRQGTESYGLTVPLLTKSDGTKFGKTESGSIWLDQSKTSPFSLFQFFLNSADDDMPHLLSTLSMRPVEEVNGLIQASSEHPQKREAQRALAREMVTFIHGPGSLVQAERLTAVLFGGPSDDLTVSELATMASATPTTDIPRADFSALSTVDALVASGLASSKTRARELVRNGAVRVFDEVIEEAETPLGDRAHGAFILLRRGRKTHHLLRAV